MPGVMGTAVTSVNRLGMAFKALIANPIVLALTAVVGVIAALVKAFKNSQPLMDAFHKVSAAIGATFKVLLDRLSNFVEFLGSVFNKELREARRAAKELNDELIGIEETMTRREKRELRRANRKGILEEIKEEAKAAYDLTKAEQALEDAEIAWIKREAELRREVEELINSSKDENLTNKEKLKNLDEAILKTKELTIKEVFFAKERARISQERLDQGKSSREEMRQNEELQAAAAEAEARGLKEQKRILSERFTLINKLTAAEQAELKEREEAAKKSVELAEKEMEAAKKQLTKELDDYKKYLADKKIADAKALADKRQQQIEQAEWEREQQIINQENLLAIRELNYENIFDIERNHLRMQQEEEIRIAEETGANINLINEKYRLAQIDLTKQEQLAKLSLYADFASSIAQLFGEQTVIGRLAAVAMATINTYKAASEALAAYPPPFSYIAMAAAIAAGLANVKKILAVKSGLPGDTGGGTAPTAIASSIPAQRMYAQQVGASIIAPPTQTQINALPNQNLLTAADIAAAIAKLPAPIVTVEDINARVASVKKVEVRSTI